MTTLVMVKTNDDVILGWDSLNTNGREQNSGAEPKVFVRDGIIYGVAGSIRGADLVQTADLPVYTEGDPRLWLIREWVPAMRAELANERHLVEENGSLTNVAFMCVVAGQPFEFDSLLSPTQNSDGIYTAGSGGDYARGALYAGASVMEALHVAGRIDAYTGGAYTVAMASRYLEVHGE